MYDEQRTSGTPYNLAEMPPGCGRCSQKLLAVKNRAWKRRLNTRDVQLKACIKPHAGIRAQSSPPTYWQYIKQQYARAASGDPSSEWVIFLGRCDLAVVSTSAKGSFRTVRQHSLSKLTCRPSSARRDTAWSSSNRIGEPVNPIWLP